MPRFPVVAAGSTGDASDASPPLNSRYFNEAANPDGAIQHLVVERERCFFLFFKSVTGW